MNGLHTSVWPPTCTLYNSNLYNSNSNMYSSNSNMYSSPCIWLQFSTTALKQYCVTGKEADTRVAEQPSQWLNQCYSVAPNLLFSTIHWEIGNRRPFLDATPTSFSDLLIVESTQVLFWISSSMHCIGFHAVGVIKSCHTRRSLFLGRFWTKIQSDNCFETVSTPGLLLEGWHCSSSNFVYNFNKPPWFPLMWMVRLVTFVHKYL